MSSASPSTPPLKPLTRWLVLAVAAIGFLFDTYELLMFPVIGEQAIVSLLHVEAGSNEVREWSGRMLWIAALCGGVFGLLGGFLVDRFGRKRVMLGAILAYSVSPLLAAYSTEFWHFVVLRCTTFVGVCVELVAAVTWLAELFEDRRSRERAIGWTLAFASVGGILVTEVFDEIRLFLAAHPEGVSWLTDIGIAPAAWRYTLLTGLVPGALILLLMPFVPESRVWKTKKVAGTLQRPRIAELFSPKLRRTTIVTTLLSACGYAAAFGALQLGPLVMAAGLPDVEQAKKDAPAKVAAAAAELKTTPPGTPKRAEAEEKLGAAKESVKATIAAKKATMQRWQEIGGLIGRILFAVLLVYVASQLLIRLFLVPGLILFPLTYLVLFQGDFTIFCVAVFFCGLVTIAQFSYVSEYLPKVFPVHLRGTGSGFATNVGGRMLGTMAAILNTSVVAPLFTSDEGNPMKVAKAAAIIGGTVYAIALVLSFMLPPPRVEEDIAPPPVKPDQV